MILAVVCFILMVLCVTNYYLSKILDILESGEKK